MPLSFDSNLLLTPSYTPLSFLLSRKHIHLSSLKQDLLQCQSAVKAELIDLLNRDYESFIALSTNLLDVEETLQELSPSLQQIHAHVDSVNTRLVHTIQQVQSLIQHQHAAQKQKVS